MKGVSHVNLLAPINFSFFQPVIFLKFFIVFFPAPVNFWACVGLSSLQLWKPGPSATGHRIEEFGLHEAWKVVVKRAWKVKGKAYEQMLCLYACSVWVWLSVCLSVCQTLEVREQSHHKGGEKSQKKNPKFCGESLGRQTRNCNPRAWPYFLICKVTRWGQHGPLEFNIAVGNWKCG